MTSGLSELHRAFIRDAIRREIPDAQVFLFGSRADGTARASSDADIAVQAGVPITPAQSARLAEIFSESDLPFFVDVVDMRAVSPEFLEIIEHGAVPLG